MTDAKTAPSCRECGLRESDRRLFWDGADGRLCYRDFDRIAPRGYAVCRLCGYEKPIGLPCGEPCV